LQPGATAGLLVFATFLQRPGCIVRDARIRALTTPVKARVTPVQSANFSGVSSERFLPAAG
jgi:hypothetical protein